MKKFDCINCCQYLDPQKDLVYILPDNEIICYQCGMTDIEIYTVHWDGELKHLACIEAVVEYGNRFTKR